MLPHGCARAACAIALVLLGASTVGVVLWWRLDRDAGAVDDWRVAATTIATSFLAGALVSAGAATAQAALNDRRRRRIRWLRDNHVVVACECYIDRRGYPINNNDQDC